jgi:aminomethyltransferase
MPQKTPLNKIHKQLGARMVEFAGWEMPVVYQGVKEEHLAVRKKAGLFDVSHMGEIEIKGPQAESIVQKVTCNDASRLKPGQSQYSAFLTEKGTFVDDVIVNRLAADCFLICVNASNTDKDYEWIRRFATGDTSVENRSDNYSLIALQGPEAEKILNSIRARFVAPVPARPFTLVPTDLAGGPVIISRTGYTGEDGFEIYGRPEDAEKIWNLLQEQGAVPCGLGARDTLRLEAAYPLYGHEIDETINPYEANLGWIVKLEKGEFIGQEALRKLREAPLQKKLAGVEMTEAGIARQGCKIYQGDREIGGVTSGTLSPFLDRAIALGYVKKPFDEIGTKIAVDIHRKRRQAIIVSLPFYKRK